MAQVTTGLTAEGQLSPLAINGRYRVCRQLGSGATSQVFEVQDLRQGGARRALKLLHPDADEALLQAEFARLSRLDHPSLAKVYDLDRLQQPLDRAIGLTEQSEADCTPQGQLFIVLEQIDGADPRQHRDTLPESARDHWLRQLAWDLASALDQLHCRGLVHHDLKPGNILVTPEGKAVLIDLGLATQAGQGPAGRGTLPYLAPEALVDGADHRADLYSLGATLFELAQGQRPFDGQGAKLVRQIFDERPVLRCAWASRPMHALVLRLLEKDPARRPASARVVLAELARMAGDQEAVAALTARPQLLPPTLVGREAQLATLAAAFSHCCSGRLQVIVLAGEPGLGKSRLLQEALRRHQLAAAAGRVPQLDYAVSSARQLLDETLDPQLLEQLAVLGPASRQPAIALLAADAALQRASLRPTLIHLPDLSADPLDQELLAVLLRDPEAQQGRPLLIVAEAPRQAELRELVKLSAGSPDPTPALLLRLEPLDRQQLGQLATAMTGGQLPQPALASIDQLSAGHPAVAQELIRRWHLEGDAGLALEHCELPDLVSRLRASLPEPQQRVLDSLAVWGAEASAGLLARLSDLDLEQLAPALEALLGRGAVVDQQGQLCFPSALHQRCWLSLVEELTAPAELARLHQRAAEQLQGSSPTARVRRAEHLLAARAPGAAAAALAAGRQLATLGASGRALLLLRGALAQGEPAVRQRAAPALAQLLILRGCYHEVLELQGGGAELELVHAQAYQRMGDYAAADALLRQLLAKLEDTDQRCRAAALWGRGLLQQGRQSEVLEAAAPYLKALEQADAGALGAGALRLLETAGLAQLYLGQQEQARQLFARGTAAAQARADVVAQARFASLHGMAALLAGELPAAAAQYGRALALSLQAGDAEASATNRGNLGAVQLERGVWGEAISLLTLAVRDLRRLGRSAVLVGALCNQANLLLLLGELEASEGLLAEASKLAQALDDQQHGGFVQMLAGDLCRRQGEVQAATERYAAAERTFAAAGASRDAFLGRLARAECLAGQGRYEQARELLGELPPETELQGAWAMSRVQLATAEGAAAGPAATRVLAAHCAQLESRGAQRDLWRAAALLGVELRSQGQTRAARQALKRARTARETIMELTPEIYHEALSEEPEAARLARGWQELLEEGSELEPESDPGRAVYDDRRLRELMAINKRLNSELRLPRLLERILDTLIDLTEADRGFLLLRGADDRLEVKAARNIDRQSLEGEALALSRSIAEQAAASGQPVVTVDATEDLRFQQAVSVSGLLLRSVLAVPLMVKGRTMGTVYVDSRMQRSLFGPSEVRLVQDIADQAAIAIENARLVAENRRKASDIERLNLQLKRKLRSQAVELVEAKEELRSSRQALQVRYDYKHIVGQTPQMLALFRLLDRVTETVLPVVIQGESGTGKELVARAIHDNGARAKRPFISENCAAIPETLLESVLFGHVKGAFTGADRNRPGLFEVASGGTLFLDEVGEMSPAMQTKLLRVLQDGDLRRVGGNRVQRVDVRVIAASNRDLRELVTQGLFREDLFYRLNVVLIQLPSLRERKEDIPLLVDHLLHKHARGEKSLSGAALARLLAYHWPGNVRELENEIMRAIALGEQVIQAADLSLPARSEGQGGSQPGVQLTTLDVRTHVERLERQLISQALDQTGGNHTHAAQLLGLSRYGLLKKIKRYALERG